MNNQDRNINYLNKTFSDFKSNLINYTQTYFPGNYADFSDASPGSIFIELASYVGDVMSFYLDTQIQENFLLFAKEKDNLYAEAYANGYIPKVSYASSTNISLYQLMPTTSSAFSSSIDLSYSLIIPANTTLTSTSTGLTFITTDQVDFSDTGSAILTYVNSNFYLVEKQVTAISAQIKTQTFTFGNPQKFQNIQINDTNILQILDVSGSDANSWYEVPYLAQSSIMVRTSNSSSSQDNTNYLLSLQNVPRRFVSRFLSDGTLNIEFGAGVANVADTVILPTPDNIQLGLVPGISLLENNYNKASVFFTQQYGLAPSNISMQIRYLVGGGLTSNVPSNDITTIDSSGVYFRYGSPGGPLAAQVLASLACNNLQQSTGGRNGDEVEEIRNNALYAYSSQLRAVTKDDYILRALSMPADFGAISKVYIIPNGFTLDMYILAYNGQGQLTQASQTLKKNLVQYLSQYRIATDAINIRDAFYINISINFNITILSGYNNQQILQQCITALSQFFTIASWQINQPIVISDIYTQLLQIKGVRSVVSVNITNIQADDGSYSPYGYDISGATRNGTIYPSLDPSIFEVRNPAVDINGRISI